MEYRGHPCPNNVIHDGDKIDSQPEKNINIGIHLKLIKTNAYPSKAYNVINTFRYQTNLL